MAEISGAQEYEHQNEAIQACKSVVLLVLSLITMLRLTA